MSLDSELRAAVLPIVPICKPNQYDGNALEYCVFSYTEMPACFGDNAPGAIRYLIQLHWFLPTGVRVAAKKQQLRRALASIDCTYPSVENVSDGDGQHYVFECEYVGGDA